MVKKSSSHSEMMRLQLRQVFLNLDELKPLTHYQYLLHTTGPVV